MPAPVFSLPLADDFARAFEITVADSTALRNRVYRLRHKVFCQELGFPMENDGALEADGYDTQSIHVLLKHRPTGLDTGCVRLVLPLADGGGLPFESFGLRYVDRKLFDWKQIDSTRCCEISRLAVASNFRRRAGEFKHPDGVAENEDTESFMNRRFPYIAVSLYHAVITLVLKREYRWIFMVIEPRLQRHLQRYGVHIEQISPTFEYYGDRAVYVTTGEQFQREVNGWSAELQGLYANVHRQLLGADPVFSLQAQTLG